MWGKPTVAVNYQEVSILINEQKIYLSVWDTAGQEIYRSLTPLYLGNASVAILVVSITNQSTMNSIEY
jgi:GTPase SAR1 family protein